MDPEWAGQTVWAAELFRSRAAVDRVVPADPVADPAAQADLVPWEAEVRVEAVNAVVREAAKASAGYGARSASCGSR